MVDGILWYPWNHLKNIVEDIVIVLGFKVFISDNFFMFYFNKMRKLL